MNVGILGTGIGLYHVELYQQISCVKKIKLFGRDEQKLAKIKAQMDIEVTNNINDIITDPTIKLVDICLPVKLHKKYIIEVLKNNKHVYCETPMTYSLEDANEIKNAERKYKKKVFINLFIKFSQSHKILYEYIKTKKYGELVSLSLSRKTPALWGNLSLKHISNNLLIHELDFVSWCFGIPNDIKATGLNGRDGESYLNATLAYGNLNIELKGSSMMPKYYPFTVSYEAIFEHAVLEFTDHDSVEGEEMKLMEYTNESKKAIELTPDNSFQQAINYVLTNLDNSINNISVTDATNSLKIALEIKKQLLSDE